MADFKTHTVLGTALGAGISCFGVMNGWISVPGSLLALFLSGMGSALPDIDSDTGTPCAFALATVEILSPAAFFVIFGRSFSLENLLIGGIVIFFLIRFCLGTLIRKLTRHRGAWHSIPAGLIFGMFIYLIFHDSNFSSRIFYGSVALIGFIFHLVLDEIASVKYLGLVVKRSFGTALKFGTGSLWLTAILYFILSILCLCCIFEPQIKG